MTTYNMSDNKDIGSGWEIRPPKDHKTREFLSREQVHQTESKPTRTSLVSSVVMCYTTDIGHRSVPDVVPFPVDGIKSKI